MYNRIEASLQYYIMQERLYSMSKKKINCGIGVLLHIAKPLHTFFCFIFCSVFVSDSSPNTDSPEGTKPINPTPATIATSAIVICFFIMLK